MKNKPDLTINLGLNIHRLGINLWYNFYVGYELVNKRYRFLKIQKTNPQHALLKVRENKNLLNIYYINYFI